MSCLATLNTTHRRRRQSRRDEGRAIRSAVILWPIVKGAVMALVALAVTSDLGDAVLVAAVSGGLGVLGMVLAAWISTRRTASQIRPDLRDMRRKLEADRREGDLDLDSDSP